MPRTSEPDQDQAVYRIDLPCERTGFPIPPCDVQLRLTQTGPVWSLHAEVAPGRPALLARWLRPQPGVTEAVVPAGLAPRMLHANLERPPSAWATAMEHTNVLHLDLGADGHASWFLEGPQAKVWTLMQAIDRQQGRPGADEVRCRPVHPARAHISRRQFETLAVAVALGYYDIPHRLDLRAIATRMGVSLGSVAELLRRAEAAVLTHYVDACLMHRPEEGLAGPQGWSGTFDTLVKR